MTDYARRELKHYPHGFELDLYRRPEGRAEGDVTLDVDASPEKFTVSLSKDRGRDRYNYDASWDIEADLTPDEVRELLLAATVWLEYQEGA